MIQRATTIALLVFFVNAVGADLVVYGMSQQATRERNSICSAALSRQVDDFGYNQTLLDDAKRLVKNHPGDAFILHDMADAYRARRDESVPLRTIVCRASQ